MTVRQIKSQNEFIDIMTSMKGRKFITFGYVSGVELPHMPKKKVPNPEYGTKPRARKEINAPDWEALGNEMGYGGAIGGIVKFTTYNCKYSNEEEYNDAYNTYRTKNDELRAKYGLEPMGKASYNTDTISYGAGVKQYNGDNEENKNHLYSDQNLFGSTKHSAYYKVDMDGNVDTSKELSFADIQMYMRQSADNINPEHRKMLMQVSANGSDSGYNQLVKLGAEDEKITSYLKELVALKMKSQRFIYDKVVFMVGCCNGEYFYYLNDQMNTVVKHLACDVNISSFMELATEKYKDSIVDLKGMSDESAAQALEESVGRAFDKNFDTLLGNELNEAIKRNRLINEAVDKAMKSFLK